MEGIRRGELELRWRRELQLGRASHFGAVNGKRSLSDGGDLAARVPISRVLIPLPCWRGIFRRPKICLSGRGRGFPSL